MQETARFAAKMSRLRHLKAANICPAPTSPAATTPGQPRSNTINGTRLFIATDADLRIVGSITICSAIHCRSSHAESLTLDPTPTCCAALAPWRPFSDTRNRAMVGDILAGPNLSLRAIGTSVRRLGNCSEGAGLSATATTIYSTGLPLLPFSTAVLGAANRSITLLGLRRTVFRGALGSTVLGTGGVPDMRVCSSFDTRSA